VAWARLDEDYPDHPKVVGLSDAAFRLHVRAICYCNHYLTDGLLPNGWPNGKAELLKELIVAGLVDETPNGFRLHDFDHYQPTRAEVYAKRSAGHEAKSRAGRIGAAARWQHHGKKDSTPHGRSIAEGMADGVAGTMTENSPGPVPGPVPVRNTPKAHRRSAPPSDDGFETFWTEYPRKVGKVKAREAWDRLTAGEKFKAVQAVTGFKRAWEGAPEENLQFLAHPTTWLNGGRWNDDPAEWKRAAWKGAVPKTREGNILHNAEAERMQLDWEVAESMQAEMEKRPPRPYPHRGSR